MSAEKPLIFLHPLSKSLKGLYEAMEENGEDYGVEVYELDALPELDQLLPTLGPSIIVTSSAKKAAHTIKAHRKVLNKDHSKILLVAAKEIPRKALTKLEKVGINNIMTEPVANKQLQYKISLLLRSLKVDEEDESEDEEKHFSNKQEQKEDEEYKSKDQKEIELDVGNSVKDKKKTSQTEEQNQPEKREEQEEDEEELEDIGSELLDKIKHDREIGSWEDEDKSNDKSSIQTEDYLKDNLKGKGSKEKIETDEKGKKSKENSIDGNLKGETNNSNTSDSHYKGSLSHEEKKQKEEQNKTGENKIDGFLKGKSQDEQPKQKDDKDDEGPEIDLDIDSIKDEFEKNKNQQSLEEIEKNKKQSKEEKKEKEKKDPISVENEKKQKKHSKKEDQRQEDENKRTSPLNLDTEKSREQKAKHKNDNDKSAPSSKEEDIAPEEESKRSDFKEDSSNDLKGQSKQKSEDIDELRRDADGQEKRSKEKEEQDSSSLDIDHTDHKEGPAHGQHKNEKNKRKSNFKENSSEDLQGDQKQKSDEIDGYLRDASSQKKRKKEKEEKGSGSLGTEQKRKKKTKDLEESLEDFSSLEKKKESQEKEKREENSDIDIDKNKDEQEYMGDESKDPNTNYHGADIDHIDGLLRGGKAKKEEAENKKKQTNRESEEDEDKKPNLARSDSDELPYSLVDNEETSNKNNSQADIWSDIDYNKKDKKQTQYEGGENRPKENPNYDSQDSSKKVQGQETSKESSSEEVLNYQKLKEEFLGEEGPIEQKNDKEKQPPTLFQENEKTLFNIDTNKLELALSLSSTILTDFTEYKNTLENFFYKSNEDYDLIGLALYKSEGSQRKGNLMRVEGDKKFLDQQWKQIEEKLNETWNKAVFSNQTPIDENISTLTIPFYNKAHRLGHLLFISKRDFSKKDIKELENISKIFKGLFLDWHTSSSKDTSKASPKADGTGVLNFLKTRKGA